LRGVPSGLVWSKVLGFSEAPIHALGLSYWRMTDGCSRQSGGTLISFCCLWQITLNYGRSIT
jgi:hypothetical protein